MIREMFYIYYKEIGNRKLTKTEKIMFGSLESYPNTWTPQKTSKEAVENTIHKHWTLIFTRTRL